MSEPSSSRLGPGQWLILAGMALWLALVPLAVTAGLGAFFERPLDQWVELGQAAEPPVPERYDSIQPDVAQGLLATLLTLVLHLAVFVPLYVLSRRPGREFLHTTASLLLAIALFEALNAVARLPALAGASLPAPPALQATGLPARTLTASLQLAIVLPFLLFGLGALDARRQKTTLLEAWRDAGLRLWRNPTALWLALAAAAAIVWPWMLVGSLGSSGTTAANLVQALPGALNEEILFRGFALAWLWRAAQNRTQGAAASLLLYVAAQGGSLLPAGDWGSLLRFAVALLVGLLATELTVRAGGSVWPAVLVRLLSDWFPLAFVDARSREEILHWLVQVWMPMAAGGLGLLLWLVRRAGQNRRQRAARQRGRPGMAGSVTLAAACWIIVFLLYLLAGAPGFHSDGFLIVLEEQADLGQAAMLDDPIERRTWAYKRLVDTAETSQASLRAELEQRGLPYRPHYLINAIEVLERPGLRSKFAQLPGVVSALFQPGMRPYPNTFGLPNLDPRGSSGVEWNIQEVGADQVWQLGHTGQGIVVGSADSGVAWDHPALKEAYLGWNGGTTSHDYHWYDPWDGRSEPWDDGGHGTHTIGTVLGSDGENQIGVAPGARWIACRNMRHGLGNPGSYLSCMEFLLAPFPLDGDPFRGEPARGALVVNNSWGCPVEEGCLADTLRTAVEHLRAAGQMMVVSAGNEGPACGTIQSPLALYEPVLSVGAITQSDRAASFSSRGPVRVNGDERLKPDLVAPGVDVRSSVPQGYASLPGTSMAGPHVAGVVALLWSIDATLIADLDRTEALLSESAEALTVDAECSAVRSGDGAIGLATICACGRSGPGGVPNNVYGWGQVDAWAAAQKLLADQ